MYSFLDNEGRKWEIEINGTSFRDVKSILNVNLMEVLDFSGLESDEENKKENGKTQLLDRFMDDPELLVNVLFVVCREQAEKRDVSDRDFGKALGGDSIASATEAFLRALGDFFPPHKRRIFNPLMEKGLKIQKEMSEKIQKIIESPEIDKKISEVLKMPTNFCSS